MHICAKKLLLTREFNCVGKEVGAIVIVESKKRRSEEEVQ